MNCKSILILKIIHEKKNLDIYNEEEQAAAEEENVIEEETNSEDNGIYIILIEILLR